MLSFKASSIASPFPNPSFLHLGPPGFSGVAVLIVVVLFNVFLVDFPFLCLCLLFCFEIMTTNAVFPAILGFFKGVLLSVRQKKGFRQFERCSAPFFPSPPPKPVFSKTLSVFHFLLSFLFLLSSLSTFHVFSINPFSDIILVLFLWPYEQTALKDPV